MQRLTIKRRGLLSATACAMTGAALLGPKGAGTAMAEPAAAIPIQQLINGLLEVMKAGPSTPFDQRFETLAPIIDRTFDLQTILQESVGASWDTVPPEQQTMLTDAFRRYTVASYVNSFDDFNGQRFEIEPETRSVGREQIVQTKVVPKKGDSHELDYVMRQGSSGWRVVDVLADGSISRVAVQRSDFRRLLTRGGAQALANSLRTKTANLSDGSS